MCFHSFCANVAQPLSGGRRKGQRVFRELNSGVAGFRTIRGVLPSGEIDCVLSDSSPTDIFHGGARFNAINGFKITEPSPRRVAQSIERQPTKSGSGVDMCLTSCHGRVKIFKMNTVIINGDGAPAGDLFMQVQLKEPCRDTQCHGVIQCKQTNQEINQDLYMQEHPKAANGSTDVFLLITPAQATEFDLPPRCGMVSAKEFSQYFGPFASRAYRSLLEPPNINTAPFHVLCRVQGVGDATAKKIVKERKKRRFSGIEDVVSRLCTRKARPLRF